MEKALTGARGAVVGCAVGSGEGWDAHDVVCTSGPGDRVFEERHRRVSIAVVLQGTFTSRGDAGPALLSPGALFLGNAGRAYECGHAHGEGDRCLSFQFEPGLFERIARDAGARSPEMKTALVPPLRPLSPLVAAAWHALQGAGNPEALEELAFTLAGEAVRLSDNLPRPETNAADERRVTRALRRMEADPAAPHPLAELAQTAGMSRFHFLRTFRRVAGVTPHQWLLRARLREAARRLRSTEAPVTDVCFEAGFSDPSNFVRSFRAEFGASPRRYRAA